MKKLMIAVAIVCAATMSQASQFTWGSKTTGTGAVLWDGTDKANAKTTFGQVAVYLFDAATYDQATAFADLTGKGLDTAKAISTATLSTASKVPTTTIQDYGTSGNYYDFYFATILDDKTFYISSMMEDQMAKESGATAMQWSDLASNSKTTLDASAGFKGAGVYSAVPEPTSGLLLLLGIAGMALRRRHA